MKILYEDNDDKNVLFVSGNGLTIRYYNENGTTREEITVHKNSAQVVVIYPRLIINIEVGLKTYSIRSEDAAFIRNTYEKLIVGIFG